MKHTFTRTLSLAAAIVALPALSLAADKTPVNQLNGFRAEASDTAAQATQLEMLARNMATSRDATAEHLSVLKDDVNTLAARVKELSALPGASTEERKAVEAATPLLANLAAEANASIKYLNAGGALWLPEYKNHVRTIVTDSRQISKIVAEYDGLAQAKAKEKHLETELGE